MLRYAITPGCLGRSAADGSLGGELDGELAALAVECRRLSSAGVDLILLREKDLGGREQVRAARGIVAAVGSSGVRVLVARRADVALAAGAAGVHLSSAEGELTPGEVRRLIPAAFVSVSCHTVDQVRRACEQGADAVLFGPVFGKWVAGREVTAPVGLGALRLAVEAAGPVPVLALGGVMARDVEACEVVGAAGVAGIRLFFGG